METVSQSEIETLIGAAQDNANPRAQAEAARALARWAAEERAGLLKFEAGAATALMQYSTGSQPVNLGL